MIKTGLKISLTFFLLGIAMRIFSQGSYYTNQLASSLYLNPSNSALISNEKIIRISTIYKNQWPNVSEQLDSRYIEINSQLGKLNLKNNKIKVASGFFINQNVQGIGKLRNTDISPNLSLYFLNNINKDLSIYFTGGFGGILMLRSFDFSNYVFNDMLVTGSGISRESNNFIQANESGFSLSSGLNLGLSKSTKYREIKFLISPGFSNILSKSDLSLKLNGREEISPRQSFLILIDFISKQSEIYVNNKLRFNLSYVKQGAYRQSEIALVESFGLFSSKERRRNGSKFLDYSTFLDFGVSLRSITPFLNLIDYNVNYLPVRFGFTNTNNGISFGLSNDFQISSSNKLPQGLGGIQEFYFTKKFNTQKKTKDNLPCPDF